MSSKACPYCSGSALTPVTGTRKRRPDHLLVKCDNCDGHSVSTPTGVFPLRHRADPDSDAILRVVDG